MSEPVSESVRPSVSVEDSSAGESKRLFLGLPMPPEIISEIAGLAEGIRKGLGFVNYPMAWTKPETIHLTLRFLGDVPVGRIPTITNEVGRITSRHRALRLKSHEIGVFPGWGKPRILWVGIGCAGPELKQYQSEIWDAMDSFAQKSEKNRFHPHLTIARFKRPSCPESARNIILGHRRFKTGHFDAGEAVLYQSVLSPSGVVHHRLAEFYFGRA